MGVFKSRYSTLLKRHQIDAHFHDPYIMTGYRPPGDTLLNTLAYCIDTACNESFNTLSHAAAALYFVVRFYRVYNNHWHEPIYWPLMCYSLGILAVFTLSTVAHALNSLSKHARHRCFYFDYAGISIYGLGTGQVIYFYCRNFTTTTSVDGQNAGVVDAGISDNSWFIIFLVCSIGTSLFTNILMCATRRQWCTSKALYRTASCVMPFLVNSIPYFLRLWDCGDNDDDCDTTSLPLYQKHVFYLLLTALSNVFKFPERSYPGRFDAFGQSHHFVHVFIFLACADMFEFSATEMTRRKHLVDKQPIVPSLYNTLVVTFVSVLVNLLIAYMFDSTPESECSIGEQTTFGKNKKHSIITKSSFVINGCSDIYTDNNNDKNK